jgi:hypothetical protein
MKRHLLMFALFASLLGCTKSETKDGPPPPTTSASAAVARVEVDGRDQYALANDIVTALAADPDEDPDALGRVRKAWQGRRFRWELAYLPALCARADRCTVAPFDHARFKRPVAQGWLPRLQLDETSFASLKRACKDHPLCVVRVDARLTKLRLSTELPTQLALDSVEVVGARAPRSGESWIVKPRAPTQNRTTAKRKG